MFIIIIIIIIQVENVTGKLARISATLRKLWQYHYYAIMIIFFHFMLKKLTQKGFRAALKWATWFSCFVFSFLFVFVFLKLVRKGIIFF
jgi:hypothetical protein